MRENKANILENWCLDLGDEILNEELPLINFMFFQEKKHMEAIPGNVNIINLPRYYICSLSSFRKLLSTIL